MWVVSNLLFLKVHLCFTYEKRDVRFKRCNRHRPHTSDSFIVAWLSSNTSTRGQHRGESFRQIIPRKKEAKAAVSRFPQVTFHHIDNNSLSLSSKSSAIVKMSSLWPMNTKCELLATLLPPCFPTVLLRLHIGKLSENNQGGIDRIGQKVNKWNNLLKA